jgi:hypothetical protein
MASISPTATKKTPSRTRTSLVFGAQAGLIMSWLYVSLIYLFFFVVDGSFLSPSAIDTGFGMLLQATVAFLMFSFILGMAPAVLLGLLSGWLIVKSLPKPEQPLSLLRAVGTGVIICLLLALFISALFLIGVIGYWPLSVNWTESDTFGYMFFIGFPSLIYIPAGGLIGYRLFRWQKRHAQS